MTGPEEYAGVVNHVLPAWDVACGLYAAVGILGAERHRRLPGEGQPRFPAVASPRRAEIRSALGAASTLWSVYRSFRDLVDSDDLRGNPLMSVIEQPGVGRYLAPGSPIKAGRPASREPVGAPLLGEHTAEILRDDLGLGEDAIKELHERGALASAAPSQRQQ